MTTKIELLDQLDITLSEAGYHARVAHEVVACYTRKTLNSNRAIVVLECPDSRDPCEFVREKLSVCRRAAGFFIPVLYQISLQVIVLGRAEETTPEKAVDTLNNQICVLQSIYVVDLESRKVVTGVTWMRGSLREQQEAIDHMLRRTVRPDKLHTAPGLKQGDFIREAEPPMGMGYAKEHQEALNTKLLPKGAGSWIYAMLGIAIIFTIAVLGMVLFIRLFQ